MHFKHYLSRKGLRAMRFGLLAGMALAGVTGLYACAGARALRHEVAVARRDPATGVILGTEALDIDPPPHAAPTAACLVLHGFVGSRQDFADLGQHLAARGYHVRLARLPGHGTTPRDFARQSPETMLAGAEAEYRALRQKYDRVDVIGFSMGGSLATLLAARQDVHRLVLIAPYYGVTYQWFYGLRPEWWNAAFRPLIPYVIKSEYFKKINNRAAIPNIYSYRCVPTQGVATLAELGRRASDAKTLTAVRCPVLLVMAEGDGAASPAQARQAFSRLGSRQKESHWYTRSNHILLWDYDAEAAKGEIVRFLD